MSEWRHLPAGKIARQRREVVRLEPKAKYRTMGVRWYSKGAYDRGVATTETIKAKVLYRAREGDFTFNRIDTQKGAFDVVSAELDGALATNEFPLYEVDPEQIFANFLLLNFQQPDVLRRIGTVRAGSEGRARWKENDFEAWTVPVPPLTVQARIIEIIRALDEQIAALDNEVEALDGVYRGFLLSLGARYGEVKIGEVVAAAFAGGTPSRDRPEFYGGDIPWLKSGEVESDSIITASEFITDAGLRGSSAKMVPPGATVVAMYGQGDTKGRAGFVSAPISTNQAVLALVPADNVIVPRFLLHAVRSKTNDLRHRAVGSSQPNLSKGLVLTQAIPMPDSLADQAQALVAIDSVRANQAATRVEADRLRKVRPRLLSGLLDRTTEIESAG